MVTGSGRILPPVFLVLAEILDAKRLTSWPAPTVDGLTLSSGPAMQAHAVAPHSVPNAAAVAKATNAILRKFRMCSPYWPREERHLHAAIILARRFCCAIGVIRIYGLSSLLWRYATNLGRRVRMLVKG